MIRQLYQHQGVLRQLIARDVIGRYRSSALGVLWSFLTPLMMLAVYTFVFTQVFKAHSALPYRAAANGDGTAMFALFLFTGLIVHSVFMECISRAAGMIPSQVSFVKKVLFPLEILPASIVGTALFHWLMSFAVLFLGIGLLIGWPGITLLAVPLIMAPFVMLLLGLSWFLASLGVYLRDIGHVMGLLSMVLMFLSPVFYPITALPAALQPVLYLNPLTFVMEALRGALLGGAWPDFGALGLFAALSAAVMAAGFYWFQKTRAGFADVL